MDHLVRFVVPKLREFAIYRYGVEFQLVDLHWSVHESQIVDRSLVHDCIVEIEKCKQQSVGMTFLCLINQLYGDYLLPLSFQRTEFELILKCLSDDSERRNDAEKLKHFYKLNLNNMDNRYELESE